MSRAESIRRWPSGNSTKLVPDDVEQASGPQANRASNHVLRLATRRIGPPPSGEERKDGEADAVSPRLSIHPHIGAREVSDLAILPSLRGRPSPTAALT